MATKPGILTEWPWASLGNFKYLVLAPFVGHSIYSFFMGKDERQRDFSYIFILLYIVMRMVHHQMWISLSRHRTAKGDNRILDRSIEFDQVDRERNWDDQIILNGVAFYIGYLKFAETHHLPLWRTDGIIITALIHIGPMEFLYYWLHRALHHHFLYSRYHSHHHSSIVTEPHTGLLRVIIGFLIEALNLIKLTEKETGWIDFCRDDQIILNRVAFYIAYLKFAETHHLPLWRIDGIIITALIHIGPVEFLYYWLHRALHHHFLYSRYHSHHHSSIVTEAHTAVIHPFAEILAYWTASIASIVTYAIYLDFMNLMGHCNFELIPKWMFSIFPPLKYLIYTPTFHSLHHTQFRTNYSLFVPMYDYLYGTVDKSSDTLYEKSLERKAELPDVVHLTHLTTPESIYHLRLGFASLASEPHASKWYFWLLWPVTLWSFLITWIYGHTFVVERNMFINLKIQTWAIPKYSIQYFMQWQRDTINNLIEEAIIEADQKGVKVLSLGLLNQEEQLNNNGELYTRRNPKLKVKVVDGSSLAVAVVLNSIPKGTSQVVLRGHLSKVAYSIALALCHRGTQVVLDGEEYKRLKAMLNPEVATNLVPSKSYASKIWLVGDGLSEDEQLKAPKGTLFIPFSQFPPRKARKDCFYFNTPAMTIPKHLENVDSCENWLPRRVMSAWRIAGILHALEGWNENECGNNMFDIQKVWKASLQHGFSPLTMPKA